MRSSLLPGLLLLQSFIQLIVSTKIESPLSQGWDIISHTPTSSSLYDLCLHPHNDHILYGLVDYGIVSFDLTVTGGVGSLVAGDAGDERTLDGRGLAARFKEPRSCTIFNSGLAVAQPSDKSIRQIDVLTEQVTTLIDSDGRPYSSNSLSSLTIIEKLNSTHLLVCTEKQILLMNTVDERISFLTSELSNVIRLFFMDAGGAGVFMSQEFNSRIYFYYYTVTELLSGTSGTQLQQTEITSYSSIGSSINDIVNGDEASSALLGSSEFSMNAADVGSYLIIPRGERIMHVITTSTFDTASITLDSSIRSVILPRQQGVLYAASGSSLVKLTSESFPGAATTALSTPPPTPSTQTTAAPATTTTTAAPAAATTTTMTTTVSPTSSTMGTASTTATPTGFISTTNPSTTTTMTTTTATVSPTSSTEAHNSAAATYSTTEDTSTATTKGFVSTANPSTTTTMTTMTATVSPTSSTMGTVSTTATPTGFISTAKSSTTAITSTSTPPTTSTEAHNSAAGTHPTTEDTSTASTQGFVSRANPSTTAQTLEQTTSMLSLSTEGQTSTITTLTTRDKTTPAVITEQTSVMGMQGTTTSATSTVTSTVTSPTKERTIAFSTTGMQLSLAMDDASTTKQASITSTFAEQLTTETQTTAEPVSSLALGGEETTEAEPRGERIYSSAPQGKRRFTFRAASPCPDNAAEISVTIVRELQICSLLCDNTRLCDAFYYNKQIAKCKLFEQWDDNFRYPSANHGNHHVCYARTTG